MDSININRTQKKIIYLLSEEHKNYSKTEIADELDLKRQTIHKHLPELRELGIVTVDDSKRKHRVKLSEEYSDLSQVLTSKSLDNYRINHTSPKNAAIEIGHTQKGYGFKAAAYRTTNNQILNKKLRLKEGSYTIEEILNKILEEAEDQTQRDLKKKSEKIFEELIEDHDVREKYLRTEKNSFIDALIKSTQKYSQIIDVAGYDKIDEELFQEDIPLILLRYRPHIINWMGGDTERYKEEIREKSSELSTSKKATLKHNSKPDEVRKVLEVTKETKNEASTPEQQNPRRHIEVLTEKEEELLENLLKEIQSLKKGDMILTVTKNPLIS